MAYFVTGATGFIGRFLVANLLKRGEPVYVLVRKGSLKKLAALRERLGRRREAGRSRSSATSAKKNLGVADADLRKLKGKVDALLPPGRHLRPRRRRRGASSVANVDGTRNAVQLRRGDRRRLLPPRELDRRGRPVRRRVPRGHVRGGRGPRPPVLHAPSTSPRSIVRKRVQAAVPDLPARASSSATRRPARWTRSTGPTTSSS